MDVKVDKACGVSRYFEEKVYGPLLSTGAMIDRRFDFLILCCCVVSCVKESIYSKVGFYIFTGEIIF